MPEKGLNIRPSGEVIKKGERFEISVGELAAAVISTISAAIIKGHEHDFSLTPCLVFIG